MEKQDANKAVFAWMRGAFPFSTSKPLCAYYEAAKTAARGLSGVSTREAPIVAFHAMVRKLTLPLGTFVDVLGFEPSDETLESSDRLVACLPLPSGELIDLVRFGLATTPEPVPTQDGGDEAPAVAAPSKFALIRQALAKRMATPKGKPGYLPIQADPTEELRWAHNHLPPSAEIEIDSVPSLSALAMVETGRGDPNVRRVIVDAYIGIARQQIKNAQDAEEEEKRAKGNEIADAALADANKRFLALVGGA